MKSFKPQQNSSVRPAGSNQSMTGQVSAPNKSAVVSYHNPSKPQNPNQNKPQFNTPVSKGAPMGDVVRLIPLGGVGDVTKNMYVYEYKDDIVIVDCGVSFPEESMPGVDLVIPDISYLRDKKSKIRGIVITHGHDDHYGALPYIWPELDVPIYSQKLTCGLIRNKFIDHKLPKDKIREMKIDDTIQLGAFKISVYQVSHSVPDSTGVVLETPVGTIIHQADFKIDWTPVNGQVPDVGRVAELGKKGVLMMTIDCLRSEKAGYTISEKTIQPTFEKIESETKGQLLITLITSNITRIQQALNVAVKSGRKVAFVGRSMENNVQVARDLGYLDVPPGVVINQEEVKRFAPEKLMIIIAGSLGQAGSALSRVAHGDHKNIRVSKTDTVVFSADPMPSAEMSQGMIIDALSRIGCKVYYSRLTEDLHVSGHAAQEELKLMINLAKPQNLMPMGGNFRHMRAFVDMVKEMGYKDNQIFALNEVQVIEIGRDKARLGERVREENVYVDGFGVGDVGQVILRDRQLMSEEGVVVVIARVDMKTGRLVGEPDVMSRGFVFGESGEDITGASKEIVKSIFSSMHGGPTDFKYIRHEVEDNLGKFFYEETKRKPLILTTVVEM
jgi:ribonuclease J